MENIFKKKESLLAKTLLSAGTTIILIIDSIRTVC